MSFMSRAKCAKLAERRDGTMWRLRLGITTLIATTVLRPSLHSQKCARGRALWAELGYPPWTPATGICGRFPAPPPRRRRKLGYPGRSLLVEPHNRSSRLDPPARKKPPAG